MDPRGPAPMAICPRCGTEAPPSYERIVICASCTLGFTPAGDLVVAPRRTQLVPESPAEGRLVKTTRTAERTRIRVGGQGRDGVAPILLGVAWLVLIRVVENPVLRLLQAAFAFGALLIGLTMVDARAVLVDRRWIETRRIPLTIWRRRLARSACVSVAVVGTHVRALTADGREHLVLAAPDANTAALVAFEVRAAMHAHPVVVDEDGPPDRVS